MQTTYWAIPTASKTHNRNTMTNYTYIWIKKLRQNPFECVLKMRFFKDKALLFSSLLRIYSAEFSRFMDADIRCLLHHRKFLTSFFFTNQYVGCHDIKFSSGHSQTTKLQSKTKHRHNKQSVFLTSFFKNIFMQWLKPFGDWLDYLNQSYVISYCVTTRPISQKQSI